VLFRQFISSEQAALNFLAGWLLLLLIKTRDPPVHCGSTHSICWQHMAVNNKILNKDTQSIRLPILQRMFMVLICTDIYKMAGCLT